MHYCAPIPPAKAMEQIIKAADAPAAIAMVFCCVAIRCVMQAAVDKVQGLYKKIKMCQFWQTWQLTICYTEHRITKCTHAIMYNLSLVGPLCYVRFTMRHTPSYFPLKDDVLYIDIDSDSRVLSIMCIMSYDVRIIHVTCDVNLLSTFVQNILLPS